MDSRESLQAKTKRDLNLRKKPRKRRRRGIYFEEVETLRGSKGEKNLSLGKGYAGGGEERNESQRKKVKK